MDRSLDSIHKQLNAILEPQRRIQEQFAHMFEPHHRIQEQLSHILEPQRKMQAQLAHIFEPQRKIQEQLAHILEPHRKIQQKLAHIFEPQLQLQKQLASALEPHRQMQEQLAHIFEPQRQFQENIRKYLKPLNQLIENPLMQQVALSESGDISVAGEYFDIGTVTDDIEDLSSEWQSSEEFIARFFSLLEKLNESARAVFLYLFLPYVIAIFANLTTPIYQELLESYQRIDQRAIKKEIIREASHLYEASELLGHRFVYATVLHVRQANSANSEVIDEIPLGKTVRLVSKEKRWSYIEYVDPETDKKRQGWVFSRYLKKFTK